MNSAFRILWLLAITSAGVAARADEAVDYVRDVKPILRARCFACHGALKQESGLRLDAAGLILKGSDDGAVVVPGDAAASRMIQRVTASDPAERMPPEGEPLSAEQIAALTSWIASGASMPADEKPERDPRDHWSFRPPQRPAVPAIHDGVNPIDAFVAIEREERGLVARPPAEKAMLLRRVYLDLIGLPPSPDALRAFLADDAPDAYERVVERLLASPQYGERWARHWMDVWRYSDWFGRRMVPDVWNSAPQIWRWRDWIVRSLNDDKGYDRMIQEMLAADEIAPEDDEAAVATGYLIRNWYALNPNDWMRSNVEHTAKAFLGLTFNCAHCHDHKYDPITQEDYFRLRAFFEPIGIRQDRVAGEADPGPFQEYNYSVLRKIERLGAVRIFDKSPDTPTWFYTGGDERNRVQDKGSIAPGVPAVFGGEPLNIQPVELPPRAWNPGLRPAIHETALNEQRSAIAQCEAELLAARQATSTWKLQCKAAEAKLVAAQAGLASVEARIAAERAKYGETSGADVAQLAQVASQAERDWAVKSAEAAVLANEQLLAAAEAKPAEDANRVKEIETATKQLAAARTALDKARAALADTTAPATYTPFSPVYPQRSTGRRRALAQWIASPTNPLTARVAVNHIWLRHFHAPLVASVYDFGNNGAPPTHPELIDWLAVELMESGWSMKHVHRLIVTSQTYRMSSSQGPAADNVARDAENKFLWRMNVGRMEAEVVRDSLLFSADRLDLRLGGQELENSEALTTRRRSLYYSCHPEADGKSEFGALFDAAEALECYRRTRSVVPQQALALTNSELIHELSAAVSESLWSSLPPGDQSPQTFVVAAYEQILSRRPTPSELAACQQFLDNPSDQPRAREGLVRVLLNHNDFVAVR